MKRVVLLLILLLTLAVPIGTPIYAAPTLDAEPGELLIKFETGWSLTANGTAFGPETTELNWLLGQSKIGAARQLFADELTYHVRLAESTNLLRLAAQLEALPGVAYAEPNYRRSLLAQPNDPIIPDQWALNNIQAPAAWDITTGDSVVIAVIDTGISGNHPDLKDKIIAGYDFVNNDPEPNDDDGHGTFVSGVIAANTNNSVGIAGVCWGCRILPVKVLGAFGIGSDAAIARGIRWAADRGVRVISMSLGSSNDSQVLREAVQYAYQRNVVLIAASGNNGTEDNAPNYPAAYPEVLSVSATDSNDQVADFSTTGEFLDLAAPGVEVVGLGRGESYLVASGTSMACPHVAGAAGLLLSLRRDLSNEQVYEALRAGADDLGDPGVDALYGHGRLNALRSLQFVAPAAPQPAPQPPLAAPAFAPVPPPTDGTLYFGETGHTLRGEFRTFWERNGGLAVFGFPISEEFVELGTDGREYVVQYFERHRLELHPENAPPYNVLLGRMGADRLALDGRDWLSFPKTGEQAGCRFFPETGQSVCGEFLAAWRANGLEIDGRPGKTEAESLALFGLPLSGIVVEEVNGVQREVQWFERARFELHAENQPPFRVLFGLLASDLARKQGWIP